MFEVDPLQSRIAIATAIDVHEAFEVRGNAFDVGKEVV